MTMHQDVHPADDYSHKFFIWHEWIQANGPLTADNVLDYFATSMFYDKQSNNQVLRMQTIHTGTALQNEAEELKRFTGIEFAVVRAEPPTLFVIHKRNRVSPDEVQPLVAYFILHNRIYQAPDVYSVVSNRLLTTLHALQASLETIRSHRPNFTPRLGFVWPIVDSSAASQGAGDEAQRKTRASAEPPDTVVTGQQAEEAVSQPVTTGVAASKKTTVSSPLYLAMTTTAAHAKTTLIPHFRDRAPSAEAAAPEQVGPPSASPAPLPSGVRAGSTDAPPPKKKRKRTATAAPSLS